MTTQQDSGGSTPSVKVTFNAKGAAQIEVKIYGRDPATFANSDDYERHVEGIGRMTSKVAQSIAYDVARRGFEIAGMDREMVLRDYWDSVNSEAYATQSKDGGSDD